MGFMMHKVGLEQVRNRISRFLYTSKKKAVNCKVLNWKFCKNDSSLLWGNGRETGVNIDISVEVDRQQNDSKAEPLAVKSRIRRQCESMRSHHRPL